MPTDKRIMVEGDILGSGLYGGVVILDIASSFLEDHDQLDDLFRDLAKISIFDGIDFQVDNSGDLIMEYDAYKRCQPILKKFGVQALDV